MNDNELFLPIYSLNRSERNAANLTDKRGGVNFISKLGSVLFGTKSHFDTTPLEITSAPKGSSIAYTMNKDNEKLLLVCFHKASSVSPYFIKADKVVNIFEEILNLGTIHDYRLIGGDLNQQAVDWNTRMKKNDLDKPLLDLLEGHNLNKTKLLTFRQLPRGF